MYSLSGCSSTIETAMVTVNSTPTIDMNEVNICEGITFTLNPNVSSTGGTYLWSPNNEVTETITITLQSTSTYSVVYTLNGCESNAESSVVSVAELPYATISGTDNIITVTENNAFYEWLDCNDENAVVNGETEQSYAPVSNGSYAVQIT